MRLGVPATSEQQIIIAAMGPRTTAVAAQLADGWCPMFIARDRFRSEVDRVRSLRAASGGDPGAFRVFGSPFFGVHPDLETATAIAASGLAWYLTAMGDTYARLTANQGFEQEVAAVLEANRHPRPDTCVIPPGAERLLEQFAVIATPATLNEALTIWDEASDVTLVGMPAGQPVPQLLAMVEAAAPSPTENPPL